MRVARRPRHAAAPWAWALGGALVGLLGALLFFAPAQWAAGAVQQASEGRVQLLDARGTLWDGSALLMLAGGAGSHDAQVLPSRLTWRLRPRFGGVTQDATSPQAGLELALQADCCTPAPLTLRWGWQPGGMALSVADAPTASPSQPSQPSQWPAGLLAGLGTPWNTLDLEGRLLLRTQGLALHWEAGRLRVDGHAELSLLDASSRLATLRPLGSYRLQLDGGPLPRVTLDTLAGALQLQGSGQWVGERLRFTGEAQAQPGREAALDNLLNIIGRRAGARALITLG